MHQTRRRFLACIAWTVAIGLLGLPSYGAAYDLKVMSFNIRTGNANDGINSWERIGDGEIDRRELVVTTIKNYNPDILGLQEDLRYQADYLQDNISGYSMFRRSVNGNETGEHVAILYKTDRFTRLRAGRFWLSDTPDEPSTFNNAEFNRIVNWVELRDVNNPDHSFVVMNTHWEHGSRDVKDAVRLKSATLMREKMLEIAPNTPIIFTGDFNADEGSDPYRRMTSRDGFVEKPVDETRFLIDTYRNKHNDSESVGTAHGFDGTAGSGRIDWILHTDLDMITLASAIDRSSFNGRYPSDHFPITATIRPTQVPEPGAAAAMIFFGATSTLLRRRPR